MWHLFKQAPVETGAVEGVVVELREGAGIERVLKMLKGESIVQNVDVY